MKLRSAGVLILALSTAASLQAAVAVVRSDEAMVRTAPAIVSGTVVETYARHDDRGDIETVVRILVDESLKGAIPTGEILDVIQFGGILDGRSQAQSGAPTYELGARYLIFLDRNGNGKWTTFDLALGQFRFTARDGRPVLVRDTREISGWTESGEAFRDFDRPATLFLALIRDVERSPQSAQLHIAPLANDFDVKAVTQNAVGSWAGAESPMNDSVSGTPAGGDTKNLDDCESRVIADDPHGDISGTFGGSGIIATAFFGCGPCGGCATSLKNSENYRAIDEIDVVINDGVSTSTISAGNFLSAMVHELGHTWGFRHSNQNASNGTCGAPLPCSSSAIMNSSIVGGLNGALQSWDRDAANEVYGDGTRQAGFTGSQYVAAFDLPARRPTATSWRISQTPCTPPGVPSVSANPTSIQVGQSSQLSTSATGSNPTFTWFTGSPGNTTTQVGTGAAINVSPTTTTSYWVRASACSQTADSASSVTVTVTQPPCTPPTSASATQNPSSVVTGGTSQITVASNGTAPLTYQLMQGNPPSGVSVGSSTSSPILTTPPLSSTTTFYVDVTNACGRVSTNPVTITVQACSPPTTATATANPTSLVAGTSTTLIVGSNGTGPLGYQWFTGNPPSGSPIIGANTQSLQQSPGVTTTYYAQVSNSCGGPINSSPVTVTVSQSCTAPSNAVATATPNTINAGQTSNLAVTASGTGLTFQWFTGTPPGGTSIPGATSATVPVTPSATTTYFARVTGQCGTLDSNAVTVTVNVTPTCVDPTINTQPAGAIILSGTSAVLSVEAGGTAPLHYQWFEGPTGDTSKPRGTDSATFNTGAMSKKTQFWVQVRGNCSGDKRANSNTATVEVRPAKHPAAKH